MAWFCFALFLFINSIIYHFSFLTHSRTHIFTVNFSLQQKMGSLGRFECKDALGFESDSCESDTRLILAYFGLFFGLFLILRLYIARCSKTGLSHFVFVQRMDFC